MVGNRRRSRAIVLLRDRVGMHSSRFGRLGPCRRCGQTSRGCTASSTLLSREDQTRLVPGGRTDVRPQ